PLAACGVAGNAASGGGWAGLPGMRAELPGAAAGAGRGGGAEADSPRTGNLLPVRTPVFAIWQKCLPPAGPLCRWSGLLRASPARFRGDLRATAQPGAVWHAGCFTLPAKTHVGPGFPRARPPYLPAPQLTCQQGPAAA